MFYIYPNWHSYLNIKHSVQFNNIYYVPGLILDMNTQSTSVGEKNTKISVLVKWGKMETDNT